MADGHGATLQTARTAVNGRFLTRKATGIDRFATELIQAWLKWSPRAASARVLLPAHADSGAARPLGDRVAVEQPGWGGGHLWEQITLARANPEAVLLNLCNTGPMFRRSQVAVLHDASVMAHPGHYSFWYRHWSAFLSAQLMRNAGVIATVSKFSAKELTRFFGFRADGIEIIYESGEHILRAPADAGILDRLGLRDRRFVLAVGSRTHNKNFAGIVAAAGLLKDLDVQFVAAGGSNSRVFAGAPIQADNLLLAGYVSDGELRSLYENAECFVFPSFYEGFGLPPLEAMHCGCPTLVSNRAALPEICGDAAAYCDPADPRQIARELRRMLASAQWRAELKEAGRARTATFTWRGAAQRLDEILVTRVDGH